MSNFYNSKRKSRSYDNLRDRHLRSDIRIVILKCDEIIIFFWLLLKIVTRIWERWLIKIKKTWIFLYKPIIMTFFFMSKIISFDFMILMSISVLITRSSTIWNFLFILIMSFLLDKYICNLTYSLTLCILMLMSFIVINIDIFLITMLEKTSSRNFRSMRFIIYFVSKQSSYSYFVKTNIIKIVTKRCSRKTYFFVVTFITFKYMTFEAWKIIDEKVSAVAITIIINLLIDLKFITMTFFVEAKFITIASLIENLNLL